jgi:uncharacterized membrane protein
VNTLPLHPAVVHVPLGLALVMPLLLAGLVWAIVTRRFPARAWLLGLLLQGVVLGGAAIALRTGEQDEERVEARAGEVRLEAHERAAQAFTLAAAGTFVAAIVALALRNRPRPFLVSGLGTVALSVGMLALGIQTGHRGGLLVHGGAGIGAPTEGGQGGGEEQATGQEGHDDEDDD